MNYPSIEMPPADWFLTEYAVFFSEVEVKILLESYARTMPYLLGQATPKNNAQEKFILNVRPGGVPKTPAEMAWAKFFKLIQVEKKWGQMQEFLRKTAAREVQAKKSVAVLEKEAARIKEELVDANMEFKRQFKWQEKSIKAAAEERINDLESQIKALSQTVEKIKEREQMAVNILQKVLPNIDDSQLEVLDGKSKTAYETIRVDFIKRSPALATSEDIKFLARERFYWKGITYKELINIRQRAVELSFGAEIMESINSALKLLTPNNNASWSRESAFVEHAKTDGQ